MFYIDSSYIIFILPALIFAGIAQSRINNAYNKYIKVSNSSGLTGAEVARTILDRNGLS